MTNSVAVKSDFADLGLRKSVLKGVQAAGFEFPTDIQRELIPRFLSGKDLFGQARTGTGKTAAFGLPLLHLVEKETPVQALILVPTRELAQQVEVEINRLGQFTPVRALAIYGGEPIRKQVEKLKRNPQIIVGTPGRVMDLHQRRILPYDHLRHVVLDEVDRMLDIGFRDDIRDILKSIPGHPQTVFVSATISEEIESLARRFMQDPEKIETIEGSLTVAQVEHSYLTVQPWDKRRLLLHLLTHEEPDLTLVFCRTKDTVDNLRQFLQDKGIDAFAIHGDMPQRKRNAIMKRLRAGNLSVIVASDLAARGLDVTGISHVVNYDLPEDPEVYVHRIGRTARAGRHGIAWSFVTPDQGPLLTNIEITANTEIPRKEYPDFQPGPEPEHVRAAREAEARRRQALEESTRLGPAAVWEAPEVNPEAFPGGVKPTKAPARRLGGKVHRRRR